MPSTVIRRFEHSPEARELTVEFVSGRRYVYSDVPVERAERMRRAFAKGSYFNRHIRGRYPCREVVLERAALKNRPGSTFRGAGHLRRRPREPQP